MFKKKMTNENIYDSVHSKLSKVLFGLVKVSAENGAGACGHSHGGHFDDTYLHRLLDLMKSPPPEISKYYVFFLDLQKFYQ